MLMLMHYAPRFVPALGAAALIAVAQLFVRERSVDAANRLFVAGGLVLLMMASHFLPLGPVAGAIPLITVAAAGCAVWALFLLGDAVHPKPEGQRLPQNLEALRGSGEGSGLVGRITIAVFAVLAVLGTGTYYTIDSKAAIALACAAAVLGGHLLYKRGNMAIWVLDRHPEWVVWIYPSKLTVISRRYGTRTTYWRAFVGLSNGTRLLLPAGDEAGAVRLSAEVASVCPGAAVGHTGDLEAQFRMNPSSLRKGAQVTAAS